MAVADGFHVDTNGNLWLGSDRELLIQQLNQKLNFM